MTVIWLAVLIAAGLVCVVWARLERRSARDQEIQQRLTAMRYRAEREDVA